MDIRTAHALSRFGLGRGAADPAVADPVIWLRDQLRQPDDPWAGVAPSTAEALTIFRADRENKPGPGESLARELYRGQGLSAIARAVATATPFRERLVWFWTNHFTVSLRRGECAPMLGAFVAEAIRPHVTGRFQDMLVAVMRHPAMLVYLDNAASIGPNSPAGQKAKRGLNENLARECLELHTVSPAARYTQDDVTAFARILTGWSVELKQDPLGFVFRTRVHEPGVHRLMGHVFPEGEAGGFEALRFLASHPATQRFLAGKLVRHFVGDVPPPAAVQRVAGVLRDTNGDLGAAAAALIDLPEAWTPGSKLRSPQDLVVAGFRALIPAALHVDPSSMGQRPSVSLLVSRAASRQPGAPYQGPKMMEESSVGAVGINPAQNPPPAYLGILSGLGQPLWNAPAPNGWPDTAADWAGPEAMMRRIDWAVGFAQRGGDRDPLAIGDAVLGPLLRGETRETMARAGSRREALALLLTSPEFQRR